MKFYKIRAFLLIYLTRILGKILAVEVPPILSAAAIIENGEKVLFLDHTYTNGYGLPGGIVKPEEDIESALRREVKEETGLAITSSVYFTSTASIYKNLPTLNITFIVRTQGTEKESSEGALVWLSPNEAILNMAYPSSKITLQKYIARQRR